MLRWQSGNASVSKTAAVRKGAKVRFLPEAFMAGWQSLV